MDGCYSFYKDLGEGYVIPVLQSDPMVLNIEWIERVLRQKYWSVFKPQSLNKNVINIVDLALFQLFFLGQVYLKKRTELNVNFRKIFSFVGFFFIFLKQTQAKRCPQNGQRN